MHCEKSQDQGLSLDGRTILELKLLTFQTERQMLVYSPMGHNLNLNTLSGRNQDWTDDQLC